MTADPSSFQPRYVSDVDAAFGGIKGLMPPTEDIPRDFYRFGNNSWASKLFNDWFYSGLAKLEIEAKPGIDRDKALRHIKTIMKSFEPSCEDKEAACAYLFDLWFLPAKWEVKKVTA